MKNKSVFISYSNKNKDIANRICQELEKHGILCWIAPRDIKGGEKYGDVIDKVIMSCKVVVLVYSKMSSISNWVSGELNVAFTENKEIIPFRIDDTPLQGQNRIMLAQKQCIDAFPDYKVKLQTLVDTVGSILSLDMTKVEDYTDMPNYLHVLEALSNYEIDYAFSELIKPALSGDELAKKIIAQISVYPSRLSKINSCQFIIIKELADKGNSFAQYLTAQIHYIHKQYNEMFKYANMSAEQDDVYGIDLLGFCFVYGFGTEIDIKKGNELVEQASYKGNSIAKLFQARNLLYGWTLPKEEKRAISLIKQCCEAMISESFSVLADAYESGIGVEKDFDKAAEYYLKAIENGYPEAYRGIGTLYLYDKSTHKYRTEDYLKKGFSYLMKGAQLGVPRCLAAIALCYQKGIFVKQDYNKSFLWFKRSAEAGHSMSYASLGRMLYYENEGANNKKEAWEWFKKGAEKDDGESYRMLGVACIEGNAYDNKTILDGINYLWRSAFLLGGTPGCKSAILLYDIYRTADFEEKTFGHKFSPHEMYCDVEKDNRKAFKCLERAAKLGFDIEAVYIYGAMLASASEYEYANELEGVKYLKRAAQKGHSKAAEFLKKLLDENPLLDID